MTSPRVVIIGFYEIRSLALGTLHSVVHRAGFQVDSICFKRYEPHETLERASEREIESLVEFVRELDPVLVGLSVFSACGSLAARITGRLKERTGAMVLWGGIHPTLCPEACLAHADAVCIGEGEDALAELTAALCAGRPHHEIRNLWFRADGRIIKNPLRPLIANLDRVPFPAFQHANLANVPHTNMHLAEHGRVTPLPDPNTRFSYALMTSRGCPHRCAYCAQQPLRALNAGLGPHVRRHSVGYVMEELRRARNHYPNVAQIAFWDNVFTYDPEWIREFKELYRERINLPFFCYCHPLMTKRSTIETLKKTGATMMAMGIQSGSPRVRNEIYGRRESDRDIMRSAATLRRVGVDYAIDLILDNPLETPADRRLTLELLLRLPRPFMLVSHTLVNFPETALTRTMLERGVIHRDEVEDVKGTCFSHWALLMDLKRDNENLFWDCMYYMASRRSFPAGLVRWLSRSAFLRRHPRPLARLLHFTTDSEHSVDHASRLSRLRVRLIGRLLKIYRGLWRRGQRHYAQWTHR